MSTVSLESFLARYMSEPLSTQQRVLEAALAALDDGDGRMQLAAPGVALTISEVAVRAGCSRALVYSALRAGALRAAPLYVGGRPRVAESECNRWIRGAT